MPGPLDVLLDALVYVPVGLAVSAKEVLPELAERGRERVEQRVASARIIGQFAVQQGQAQAARLFTKAREDAQGRIQQLVPEPAAPVAPTPRPAPRPSSPTSGPGAARLAIPGYDSLSASQVLPRLDALSADELEAVRTYETAHRARKTILGRIAQLQPAS